MLNIGDTFIIQQKSREHECHIGQDVVILDLNCATDPNCYLVQDASDADFFCCLQSVPFEEVDESFV